MNNYKLSIIDRRGEPKHIFNKNMMGFYEVISVLDDHFINWHECYYLQKGSNDLWLSNSTDNLNYVSVYTKSLGIERTHYCIDEQIECFKKETIVEGIDMWVTRHKLVLCSNSDKDNPDFNFRIMKHFS